MLRGEDPKAILCGLSHIRIRVLSEATQFGFKPDGANIARDDEDRWHVLPPINGLLDKRLGALPGLDQEHAGDVPDVLVWRV